MAEDDETAASSLDEIDVEGYVADAPSSDDTADITELDEQGEPMDVEIVEAGTDADETATGPGPAVTVAEVEEFIITHEPVTLLDLHEEFSTRNIGDVCQAITKLYTAGEIYQPATGHFQHIPDSRLTSASTASE